MTIRVITILLVSCFSTAIISAQLKDSVLCTYTLENATIDTSLGDELRNAFEDDDGRPMKSISIDLNGDGKYEKFIPNEFLCGNGGCPWIIFDPQSKHIIGEIGANEIIVLKRKINGYNVLQCSWSGAGEYKLTNYIFKGSKYVEK